MRWIKAGWRQFKGRLQQGWGKLTRNALASLPGKRERTDRRREHLQKQYAVAAKELDDFTRTQEQ